MSYSPTMMRWTQQDPIGYVDGPSLYQFLMANPMEFVDPSGLTSILIHANDGGVHGHVAIIIDNPVAAGLPGAYPSGRGVLSWQGGVQGTIQGQVGDLYIYDYEDYKKASAGKVYEYPVQNTGSPKAIFDAAKKHPHWAPDMRNNCAINARDTLLEAAPDSPTVQQIQGANTPYEMQRVLPRYTTWWIGTGPKSGTSGTGSSTGSSS